MKSDHKLKLNFELFDYDIPVYSSKNKKLNVAMDELRAFLIKKLGGN